MKKKYALLLALVMLFTCLANGVTAAVFTDTEGLSCEKAVEVLAGLGIVEGKSEGIYDPEGSLTRAEMTAIILRTMRMEAGGTGTDVFTDVESSHWAYKQIGTAYQMGIVKGTSATTFHPDLPVTCDQAVKMVVAALGYTVKAESLGGYPSGYLSVASQLGLLSGVQTDGEMTRGSMAVLVYNALDKEMFVQTVYGEEAYEFAADETATLLSHYLKVECLRNATITATAMAELSAPGRRLASDEVSIGTRTVKTGATNAADMLGVPADIYVREEANEESVILAIVPRSSAWVLDLTVQDIDVQSTTASSITYYDENGREQEVSIAAAQFVYNGRNKTDKTVLSSISTGKIRLIGTGANNVDLVIAESYTNYVLDTVNEQDKKVYFKDNTSMVIDTDDATLPTVFTEADGTAAEVEDLEEWDILSVAESEDGAARRIYLSYDSVEGAVTEISAKDIWIDGVEYAVAPSVPTGTITVGLTASFILDFTGAVAAVDTSSADHTYGWLRGASAGKGIGGTPQIKVLTEEGEWQIYTLAEKVKFNGSSKTGASLVTSGTDALSLWTYNTAPTLVDSDGIPVRQLIRYKLNADGAVNEIETAENKTYLGMTDAEKLGGSFSMDSYRNGSRYPRGYDNSTAGDDTNPLGHTINEVDEYTGNFMTKYFPTAETKMFVIPADPDKENKYEVVAASGMTLDKNRNYNCMSLYDISEDFEIGAVVVRNDLSLSSAASYPVFQVASAVVTGFTRVLSEDGEPVKNIKLLADGGKEVSAPVVEDLWCLYKLANARLQDETENGVTLPGDPAWRLYDAATDTYFRPDTADGWKQDTLYRKNMYMHVDDLRPGDVVQYELNAAGEVFNISVLYRVDYPGDVEYYTNNGQIYATSTFRLYMGGSAYVSGTVNRVVDKGFVTEVNLTQSRYGVPGTKTATRVLPKTGSFLLWDSQKQEARAIAPADVMAGDRFFSRWGTSSQIVFVVFR